MKIPVLYPAIVQVSLLLSGLASGDGIAILKEQPFHRDSTATAIAYIRIVDSGGPLLRIVNGGKSINVNRTMLADWIEVPTSIPSSIANESDIAPLKNSVKELEAFITRYPQSSPLLDNLIITLKESISRFTQGQVRFEKVWMKNDEKIVILNKRKKEAAELKTLEIEKVIFQSAQRDKGLTLYMGKWMKPEEIKLIPPAFPTPLSECVKPLINGDLIGAGFALDNLKALAISQSGAPKVRTLSLIALVKNLFHAEAKLVNYKISAIKQNNQAQLRDKNATDWLKPNVWGTVNENAANEAKEDSAKRTKASALELAARRKELLHELHETDSLVEDLHKLQEFRVVLTLDAAARIVAARHFSKQEFQPSLPEETLEHIRKELRESITQKN